MPGIHRTMSDRRGIELKGRRSAAVPNSIPLSRLRSGGHVIASVTVDLSGLIHTSYPLS